MDDVTPSVIQQDPFPEWSGKRAGDYRLAVRIDTRAAGPIVVLLHGLNSDATDWQPVIDDFPMDYRIIAVDLLGYGESPKPIDIDYSCADHVAALHATLDELDLDEPFLLVGYSLGGDIALNYAATYPSDVRRLFLLSAPFYLPAEEFEKKSFSFHYIQQSVQEWAWQVVRSVPDDFTKLFNQMDTQGHRAARRRRRRDAHHRRRPRLDHHGQAAQQRDPGRRLSGQPPQDHDAHGLRAGRARSRSSARTSSPRCAGSSRTWRSAAFRGSTPTTSCCSTSRTSWAEKS